MITLKIEYPFDNNEKYIRHYATNEQNQHFKIKQIETGIIYEEAVDLYPCRYTYEVTDIPIDDIEPKLIEEN